MSHPALVRHLVARPGEDLPPAAGLYDYILGANGVFLRAERKGLRVVVPIAACEVRGLAPIESKIEFTLPRVPAELTTEMLERARTERDAPGRPLEVMYHLSYTADGWRLDKPRQVQARGSVEAVGPFAGTSYASYLIEVHSHHELDFHQFSATDDASEGTKCRLFGLLTNIYAAPGLHLRLNVYGYRLNVPASLAFELPDELQAGSVSAGLEDAPGESLDSLEALGWL